MSLNIKHFTCQKCCKTNIQKNLVGPTNVINVAVLQVRTRAWFMPDHRFLAAKCYVHLRFSSAAAYSSARAANLANLLVYALRDSLAEFCYTAATAGNHLGPPPPI